MLPTWGPLPCVKTTSWPAATRSVRRDAVASIRRRWAAASADSPAGSSALPPIATTSFVILSPRWKSRAILQNLFERSATGIRFQNGVLHGAGITIYQEGRIASFCESRDALGAGMEPPLAVPQDGLVPGHVPCPARPDRPQPAAIHGRRTRVSRHHPRAARGLPRSVLSRGTVRETLRGERAPRHPDGNPGRRSAIDKPAAVPAPRGAALERTRSVRESDDGPGERDGGAVSRRSAAGIHVPCQADDDGQRHPDRLQGVHEPHDNLGPCVVRDI